MSDLHITSPHNSKFRRWQSLLESKGIKKEGLCLVSGEKMVRELFAQQPDLIQEFILPPKIDWDFAIPKSYRLTSPMFKSLDVLGTHSPLAVVRLPNPVEWDVDPPKGLELIIALQDPANLGALLRSADAFGVRRVILTKESASPYLPKALKAASLSTFRLDIRFTGSIHELKVQDAFALDMEGETLSTFEWPKNAYLILGEEGQGIPQQLQIKRLRIPMTAKVESLNATVAASIALHSYFICESGPQN